MDTVVGYTDYDDYFSNTDVQPIVELDLDTQYIFMDRLIKDHGVIYGFEYVSAGPGAIAFIVSLNKVNRKLRIQ